VGACVSGLVFELGTGLAKKRDGYWHQFFGEIPAGQVGVIDEIPVSEFDLLKYEIFFSTVSPAGVKSLSMIVSKASIGTRDQVFGIAGDLKVKLSTEIIGSNFRVLADNEEAVTVDFSVSVLTQ
jgi:hypothetical protein